MADEYLSYNRATGRVKVKKAVVTSGGPDDAGKIVALGDDGKLDSTVLPAGLGGNTISLPAYEDLSAGDFVNIFVDPDDNTTKVRKADASSKKPAHGYVLSNVTAGDTATIHFDGHNTQLSDLTPGKYYFLADTGTVSDVPPSTGISQRVGVAVADTIIDVEIDVPITLSLEEVGEGGGGGEGGGPECYGVFGGGSGSYLNTIDYIIISTPSDATDFGDLTVSRGYLTATSNGTNDRGVFGGGWDGSSCRDTIDYTTISTPSNATDFGDLTLARYGPAATSNGTNDRGVFGGGRNETGSFATIDYITISSTPPVSATDFGNLTVARERLAATSNGTNDRGVFGGGYDDNNYRNTIDYITISTPSNATYFGDLTVARGHLAATSNGTNDRGVFGGGSGCGQVIDYITISTPSNATDFGDLTVAREYLAATSDGVYDRGVFGGGWDLNTIDYIIISSTPPVSATDFGDLTVARRGLAATSNA